MAFVTLLLPALPVPRAARPGRLARLGVVLLALAMAACGDSKPKAGPALGRVCHIAYHVERPPDDPYNADSRRRCVAPETGEQP